MSASGPSQTGPTLHAGSTGPTKPTPQYFRPKRIVQLLAAVLAATATAWLLVAPVYAGLSEDSMGNRSETRATLLEVNGPQVLVVLAIPVVLACLPLLATGRAWQPVSILATVTLGVVVALGILSIGIFYAPAAMALLVACFLKPRRRPARPPERAEAVRE